MAFLERVSSYLSSFTLFKSFLRNESSNADDNEVFLDTNTECQTLDEADDDLEPPFCDGDDMQTPRRPWQGQGEQQMAWAPKLERDDRQPRRLQLDDDMDLTPSGVNSEASYPDRTIRKDVFTSAQDGWALSRHYDEGLRSDELCRNVGLMHPRSLMEDVSYARNFESYTPKLCARKPAVAAVGGTGMSQTIEALQKEILGLRLSGRHGDKKRRRDRRPRGCWECGEDGHFVRECESTSGVDPPPN